MRVSTLLSFALLAWPGAALPAWAGHFEFPYAVQGQREGSLADVSSGLLKSRLFRSLDEEVLALATSVLGPAVSTERSSESCPIFHTDSDPDARPRKRDPHFVGCTGQYRVVLDATLESVVESLVTAASADPSAAGLPQSWLAQLGTEAHPRLLGILTHDSARQAAAFRLASALDPRPRELPATLVAVFRGASGPPAKHPLLRARALSYLYAQGTESDRVFALLQLSAALRDADTHVTATLELATIGPGEKRLLPELLTVVRDSCEEAEYSVAKGAVEAIGRAEVLDTDSIFSLLEGSESPLFRELVDLALTASSGYQIDRVAAKVYIGQ